MPPSEKTRGTNKWPNHDGWTYRKGRGLVAYFYYSPDGREFSAEEDALSAERELLFGSGGGGETRQDGDSSQDVDNARAPRRSRSQNIVSVPKSPALLDSPCSARKRVHETDAGARKPRAAGGKIGKRIRKPVAAYDPVAEANKPQLGIPAKETAMTCTCESKRENAAVTDPVIHPALETRDTEDEKFIQMRSPAPLTPALPPKPKVLPAANTVATEPEYKCLSDGETTVGNVSGEPKRLVVGARLVTEIENTQLQKKLLPERKSPTPPVAASFQLMGELKSIAQTNIPVATASVATYTAKQVIVRGAETTTLRAAFEPLKDGHVKGTIDDPTSDATVLPNNEHDDRTPNDAQSAAKTKPARKTEGLLNIGQNRTANDSQPEAMAEITRKIVEKEKKTQSESTEIEHKPEGEQRRKLAPVASARPAHGDDNYEGAIGASPWYRDVELRGIALQKSMKTPPSQTVGGALAEILEITTEVGEYMDKIIGLVEKRIAFVDKGGLLKGYAEVESHTKQMEAEREGKPRQKGARRLWDEAAHIEFQDALLMFGRHWTAVAQYVGRTVHQTRSHFQKYNKCIAAQASGDFVPPTHRSGRHRQSRPRNPQLLLPRFNPDAKIFANTGYDTDIPRAIVQNGRPVLLKPVPDPLPENYENNEYNANRPPVEHNTLPAFLRRSASPSASSRCMQRQLKRTDNPQYRQHLHLQQQNYQQQRRQQQRFRGPPSRPDTTGFEVVMERQRLQHMLFQQQRLKAHQRATLEERTVSDHLGAYHCTI
eukprot:COSAG05_NODE_166_length_15185_cov_10.343497_3_plen_771_part_00